MYVSETTSMNKFRHHATVSGLKKTVYFANCLHLKLIGWKLWDRFIQIEDVENSQIEHLIQNGYLPVWWSLLYQDINNTQFPVLSWDANIISTPVMSLCHTEELYLSAVSSVVLQM